MNTFVKVMHINTCNCAACASVPTLGIEMPYEVVKENCLAVACPKAAAMLSDKDKRLALEATEKPLLFARIVDRNSKLKYIVLLGR